MAVENSARAIVDNYLNQFGLGSLSVWAWDTYVNAGGGDTAMSTIQLELPNQPAFRTRFPAYDTLRHEGRAMSVAEMLAYEQQAIGLMRAAGLPQSFWDQPEDIANLLKNDVSVVELQQRVQLAQDAVYNSPPEVRDFYKANYGLTDGDMAAAFLDPEKALPLLKQRELAGKVGGAAKQQGFGIDAQTAEQLALAGVDQQTAQQGFGNLAQSQGLFQATAGETENIGQAEQIQAQFGTNPNAARRVRQREEQRKAAFQGGSGYGVGQGGVGGLAVG